VQNPRRTSIGIVALLVFAFLIVALPSGGGIARLLGNTLQAAFLAVIGVSLVRLHRSRHDWLLALRDRDRAIVYGAAAVALLTIVASARLSALWNGGIVLVVLVLAACAGAVYWVWRESQRWVI
jgi:hypothetical protein